jgi:hypothetical protein
MPTEQANGDNKKITGKRIRWAGGRVKSVPGHIVFIDRNHYQAEARRL